ncbi:GNAT family N-acetyltransferase [Polaribacter porphyrae]|uniref:N-acetyltransferase domain-containing protein n=1 Tax=Polaribacter porphyrae TaxID=1137780 RepID=A0A2S7WKQ2_9FLAO|nr:GNAT family N-acetyltransferase [Polaribacter porphyrae]PQJ78187.1 hypothetical protein BTO18_02820 [Polaribacter porphyrae]
MIFETERLQVRKLILKDLLPFHKMQSNPKVMQFADGEIKTLQGHEKELKLLVEKYQKKNNDFWIYAIERKQDKEFIGTVALVKDDNDDEIGYRFLEKYWGNDYGFEICKGLINYCKKMGFSKIVGYVVDKNIASAKILEKLNFIKVDSFINDEHQQETKYILKL